jgi:hypothetical protein
VFASPNQPLFGSKLDIAANVEAAEEDPAAAGAAVVVAADTALACAASPVGLVTKGGDTN